MHAERALEQMVEVLGDFSVEPWVHVLEDYLLPALFQTGGV
jgi:hypothetical protein